MSIPFCPLPFSKEASYVGKCISRLNESQSTNARIIKVMQLIHVVKQCDQLVSVYRHGVVKRTYLPLSECKHWVVYSRKRANYNVTRCLTGAVCLRFQQLRGPGAEFGGTEKTFARPKISD